MVRKNPILRIIFEFFELRMVEPLSIGFLAIGVVLSIIEIVSRYIFSKSIAWSGEIITMTLLIAVLLNYGLAEKNRRHIFVDMFVLRLSTQKRLWAVIINTIATILLSVIIVYHGCLLTIEVIKYNYVSEVLRVPTGIQYGFFVLGFILLLSRAMEKCLNTIEKLFGKQQEEKYE